MRKTAYGFLLFLFVASSLFLANCGGSGGGTGGGTGTVAMSITDARPAIPADIEHVWVTINEIMVHQSGGGWTRFQFNNGEERYTLDLLQYYDGNTTALVLPKEIQSGRYTQIRFGVESAYMLTSEATGTIRYDLEIPSEYLRTDKNFEFDVPTGQTVNLTIDFDLSQSIVATGAGSYQLKPVLHIVKAQTTIQGSISPSTFGSNEESVVVVTWDKDGDGVMDVFPEDEEYTRLIVTQTSAVDPTLFTIFWVVPQERYFVQIFIHDAVVYSETVEADVLSEGTEYQLNGGNPIEPAPPT